MNEERTARERKLRERLEKKRRAREEELEAAKVSEEVKLRLYLVVGTTAVEDSRA